MAIKNISVSFALTQPLKHSRNWSKLDAFEYRVYDKPDLCVTTYLREYLSRRSNHTNHKQLIITYGKLYKLTSPNSCVSGLKGYLQTPKSAILHHTIMGSVGEQSNGCENQHRRYAEETLL